MKKISVASLLFVVSTPLAWSLDISGTIKDQNGEPVIGAAIVISNTTTGTITDLDGTFTLKNVKDDAEINVSMIGYESKTFTASQIGTNKNITLAEDNELLEAAVTTIKVGDICEPSSDDPYALQSGTYVKTDVGGYVCKPTGCIYPTYSVQKSGNKWKCVLTAKDRTGQLCKTSELVDKNAISGNVLTWNDTDGTVTCTITKCKNGYEPDMTGMSCISNKCPCGKEWDNITQKCAKWSDTNCTSDAKNAKSAVRECPDGDSGKPRCTIKECIDDNYRLDSEKNVCIYNNGEPCTHSDPNAATAKQQPVNGKLTCVIINCKTGWDVADDGQSCTPRAGLSDADYKKQMSELNANAEKMKANETSLANKTLGAMGMGSTGIGSMMALSAYSEQTADENAENDMRAYLSTFHCTYGSGNQSRGGESNIDLPGGNDMINLYTEYAALANDLKVRKTQLGLKPGIESEIVIDKSESNLYDNAGIGSSGTYASIARALANPTGEDAKRWNEQKSKTSSNLETGATTAAIGAAGSLVANLAMNSNVTNEANNILNTYEQLKTVPLASDTTNNDAQQSSSDFNQVDSYLPANVVTPDNDTTLNELPKSLTEKQRRGVEAFFVACKSVSDSATTTSETSVNDTGDDFMFHKCKFASNVSVNDELVKKIESHMRSDAKLVPSVIVKSTDSNTIFITTSTAGIDFFETSTNNLTTSDSHSYAQPNNTLIKNLTVSQLQEDPKSIIKEIYHKDINDQQARFISDFIKEYSSDRKLGIWDIADTYGPQTTKCTANIYIYDESLTTQQDTLNENNFNTLKDTCDTLEKRICTDKSQCQFNYFFSASKGTEGFKNKYNGCALIIK